MSSPAEAAAVPPIDDQQLWALMKQADDIGLRLELTASGISWETTPGLRHQELCFEVMQSIRPPDSPETACKCLKFIDVAIRFPNGMVKRPDVSIFCQRPAEEEGFVRRVPEAVVEIVSPGYESKDLVSGPPLYLGQGVRDVLVLDRTTNAVHHFRQSEATQHPSPKVFLLECGCSVTL